ncbi:MAG: hypothetical protein ACRESQ_05715, partial [Gammaproteobacteria bacterium]
GFFNAGMGNSEWVEEQTRPNGRGACKWGARILAPSLQSHHNTGSLMRARNQGRADAEGTRRRVQTGMTNGLGTKCTAATSASACVVKWQPPAQRAWLCIFFGPALRTSPGAQLWTFSRFRDGIGSCDAAPRCDVDRAGAVLLTGVLQPAP